MANSFLMLAVLSVLLTLAAFVFREPMLRLFGASGATYPYAERYFTIYVSGTVFALMASGMNQFVISQGFALAGMKSVVLGAVCNIVLDPILIYGMKMGVAGAALATILSQGASAAYVLRFLLGKKPQVRITFGGYHLRLMGRILVMGLSPFLIIAIDSVMIITMNALLQRYGGAAQGDTLVTCNAIVQSFMLVLTMPLGGISGGTQGILGYNFGAGNGDRVLQAQRYILGLCVGYSALLFVLARAAGPLFVGLFTKDAEIAGQACEAIRIATLAAIPLGVQYEIVDGYTAMGQVRLSLPLSLWRKVVYFAAIFLLPVRLGAKAIFYAEPISDVLGPAVSIAVYLLTIRKVLRHV